MGDFAHITGLWQAVFRPFTSHLERSTRWYRRFVARSSAHIWKTRSDMGRRTYIETVAVAWTFMSRQSEGRAYIEGGMGECPRGRFCRHSRSYQVWGV